MAVSDNKIKPLDPRNPMPLNAPSVNLSVATAPKDPKGIASRTRSAKRRPTLTSQVFAARANSTLPKATRVRPAALQTVGIPSGVGPQAQAFQLMSRALGRISATRLRRSAFPLETLSSQAAPQQASMLRGLRQAFGFAGKDPTWAAVQALAKSGDFKGAQQLLTDNGKFWQQLMESWGKHLRKLAKLDKKAHERAVLLLRQMKQSQKTTALGRKTIDYLLGEGPMPEAPSSAAAVTAAGLYADHFDSSLQTGWGTQANPARKEDALERPDPEVGVPTRGKVFNRNYDLAQKSRLS